MADPEKGGVYPPYKIGKDGQRLPDAVFHVGALGVERAEIAAGRSPKEAQDLAEHRVEQGDPRASSVVNAYAARVRLPVQHPGLPSGVFPRREIEPRAIPGRDGVPPLLRPEPNVRPDPVPRAEPQQ